MNKIKLGNKDIYYQVFYKKIKHMYLRYKDDVIKVTCNKSITKDQIERFIRQHSNRILETIAFQKNKQSLYDELEMLILGKTLPLTCHFHSQKNAYSIHENAVDVWFRNAVFDPKYMEKIYHEITLEQINDAYESVYDTISRDINIKNITFKAQLMKSRLGSCIPKKRIIKLNSILARFEPMYLKTILIHELIHLAIKNHQKEFYTYIDKYIPEYRSIVRTLNKQIRKYVI